MHKCKFLVMLVPCYILLHIYFTHCIINMLALLIDIKVANLEISMLFSSMNSNEKHRYKI
jgi:formate/nitrite transporter FocA (FNT family)